MVSFRHLLAIPVLALSALGEGSPTPYPTHCKNVGSEAFHQQFVEHWLAFWNGNYSLLDQLAAPDMVMNMDRVPSPSGHGSQVLPIDSSQVFLEAVKGVAAAFHPFSFTKVGSASTGNEIAVRWTFNGVFNDNSSSETSSPSISFNGTDFIFLDNCTGLLKIYDLSQDNISRFHQLGNTSIGV